MSKRHLIDPIKGATALVVLTMMAIHSQWQNPTAWGCVAMHGAYGVLGAIKGQLFPDRQWDEPLSASSVLVPQHAQEGPLVGPLS